MSKRFFVLTIILCLVALLGFAGYAVWHSISTQPLFEADGYVIQEDGMGAVRLPFAANDAYRTSANAVKFTQPDGQEAIVSRESFLHMNNGSTSALSDGVLLDFNDLSENFINNYVIAAGLSVQDNGDAYVVNTGFGPVTFADHLWKLSDNKYLIVDSNLTVCFSDADKRPVENYVLVSVTEDGIAQLITEENAWMTISEDCYIETTSGVRIYPMTQIVDNGTYKMSLAKLSVDTDDNIVLTEDETRRQIVPKLNIETKDGEDGIDGIEGEDGEVGEEGEAGEDGVSGTDGNAGENGETGANGAAGASGTIGADGTSGEDGTSGASGTSGADGAAGENGMSGSNGTAGTDGGNGAAGSNGEAGSNGTGGAAGSTGAAGTQGSDALIDSSTNTALPRMTFVDWRVSATSLRGEIQIDDENGFLTQLDGDPNYPATVSIYNVETGEKIDCYEIENINDKITNASHTEFQYINQRENAFFATPDSALRPDTQYRISVNAYYKINDAVYSREFISRFFYTDSTGVFLSALEAAETSVGVKVDVAEEFHGSIAQAQIILLTPDQNQTYSNASNAQFTQKYVLDYHANTATLYGADGMEVSAGKLSAINYTQDLRFTGLPTNTKYIARVYVSKDGLSSLTNQELKLTTLKKAPTYTDIPKVNYNRVTGGFEVYRPAVTDVDGGAQKYTYIVYEAGTDKVVQERTLVPSEGEPAVFFLGSNVEYEFSVKLEFDDNEKTVIYDLGRSKPIKSMGATMPKLTLDITKQDYDMMQGTLQINLTDNETSIEVDATKPMTLSVYADRIYDKKITIEAAGTPVVATVDGQQNSELLYEVLLDTDNTNYAKINLDLRHLYRNTNYTISVSAYLNVGDENGSVLRELGSVSFRTLDTQTLLISNRRNDNASSAISLMLQIAPKNGTDNEQGAYAVQQLKTGQVQLQLYTTAQNRTLLGTANIYEESMMQQLYGSGLEVTEDTFGGLRLNASANYELVVADVVDATHDMGLGYINYYEHMEGYEIPITARATPPELLTNPATGVDVVPITNSKAVSYGGKYDDSLPDDAIVGYRVVGKYDNTQMLGVNITYYAMEYNEFFNTVKTGNDPVEASNHLMKVTLPINDSKNMPVAVFLFGGTKSETPTYTNGMNVYWTGEADFTRSADGQATSLVSGMDRGFRYCFAYTVQFSQTGSTSAGSLATYPHAHEDFNDYKAVYGVGKEFGKNVGQGKAYVMNSGMCEAPRVIPDLYTYVNRMTEVKISKGLEPSSGKMEIHYSWDNDPDNTISTVGRITQIAYEQLNGQEVTQNINQYFVGDKNWYSVEVPFVASRTDNGLVSVRLDLERYILSYSQVLEALLGSEEGGAYDDFYLCQMPVEWAYADYLKSASSLEKVYVNMDMNNLQDNYILFELASENAELLTLLSERTISLKVNFKTDDGSQEKTFYLPLTINKNMRTYRAQLSTGLLGVPFLNKPFTVTAQIYYDTGLQGWTLADSTQTGFVAVQQTGDELNAQMGSYYTVLASNNSTQITESPQNGLVTLNKDELVKKLRALVGSDSKNVSLQLQHWCIQSDEDVAKRTLYLYPAQRGVVAQQNATAVTGGYTVTLKDVGVYDLKFDSGKDKGTLHTLTPTASGIKHTPASTRIRLEAFEVDGFEQADVGYRDTVYVSIFEKEEDARLLKNPLNTLQLKLEADGKFKIDETSTDDSGRTFSGLLEERKYYIAYYMKVNSADLIILDSRTANKAVYPVTTSTNADLGVSCEYENTTYINKQLNVEYTLNRTYGINIRYDIFDSAEEADKKDGIPILSHEDMVQRQILNTVSGAASRGTATINLRPSANRKELVPGGTYYLKATAYEQSGSTITEVGAAVDTFTIPNIGNCSALIRPNKITSNTVGFTVSVNDLENSLMGCEGYKSGVGLYTVRFTYTENGKQIRLYTCYDDQVYSIDQMTNPFVLSNSTDVLPRYGFVPGQEIKANVTYTIHIYAVLDVYHKGLSNSIDSSYSNSKEPEYFFSYDQQTGEVSADNLHTLIESFWDPATMEDDTSMDAVEARFEIDRQDQQTTDNDGVLLNLDSAVITRSGDYEFMIVFPGSYGLRGMDNSHAFHMIEWYVAGESNNKPVVGQGYEKLSESKDLIQVVDNATGDTYYQYYFTIPMKVGYGAYDQITLHFYKTEADLAATYKKTFTFYDYGKGG